MYILYKYILFFYLPILLPASVLDRFSGRVLRIKKKKKTLVKRALLHYPRFIVINNYLANTSDRKTCASSRNACRVTIDGTRLRIVRNGLTYNPMRVHTDNETP